MNYKTLNDAASNEPALETGETEIWYQKPDHFGEMKTNQNNLEETHVLLGTIKSESLEEIYRSLQAENWSPLGEARNLILNKKLGHTSMCVGDTIVIKGKVFIVAPVGFEEI